MSWFGNRGEKKTKKKKYGRNRKKEAILLERRSKGKRKANRIRKVLNVGAKSEQLQ